jgi:ABC-type lipopolysaccharide export system ATPase subunit
MICFSPAVVLRLLLKKPDAPTVVLYGPMGSGKTTMFYRLLNIPLPLGTTTSMIPNQGNLSLLKVMAARIFTRRFLTTDDLPRK